MLCMECANWSVSEFTYKSFIHAWHEVVGGEVTPGYKDKFIKESKIKSSTFEETILRFKYCAAGRFTRFYVVRNTKDIRPKKKIEECILFSSSEASTSEFPIPSPLWSFCCSEAMGRPKVRGQEFYQGLFENGCMKIPAHGNIIPALVNHVTCHVCSKDAEKGIEVKEVKQFCCNKHYLQWWKDQHPEIYSKWK